MISSAHIPSLANLSWDNLKMQVRGAFISNAALQKTKLYERTWDWMPTASSERVRHFQELMPTESRLNWHGVRMNGTPLVEFLKYICMKHSHFRAKICSCHHRAPCPSFCSRHHRRRGWFVFDRADVNLLNYHGGGGVYLSRKLLVIENVWKESID